MQKFAAFSEYMNFIEKHGQGTHSTKMGADNLAENRPKCLPKPKNFRFLKKSSLWVFVVRVKKYLKNVEFEF